MVNIKAAVLACWGWERGVTTVNHRFETVNHLQNKPQKHKAFASSSIPNNITELSNPIIL